MFLRHFLLCHTEGPEMCDFNHCRLEPSAKTPVKVAAGSERADIQEEEISITQTKLA